MNIKPWFVLVCWSPSLWASVRYPLEFADLFLEREETVEVVIAGEVRSHLVQALVTYETFQLKNTPENIDALRDYLREQGVTVSAASAMEVALLRGVEANPGCDGLLSQCIPEDYPGQAEYVFDFDANRLKIFVSSDLLQAKSLTQEYHSAWRQENALVNHARVYAFADKESNTQLTWNNYALLGLPVGYFSLETQYQQADSEWDLYEALYDVEASNVRALVGYQGNSARSLNSTDFLGYGANYSGTGVTFGTSQNLLKGAKSAHQRIYFFAPQSGQLEVYQGERLLVSKVVTQGQQYLSYDQLPAGVYTIDLVLRQGSQELMREQRQVVNSAQFSLPVASWDYRVEAGYLDERNKQRWMSDVDDDARTYGRLAFGYRAMESLLLATGMVSNKDTQGWQVGGFWSPNAYLNTQYTGSWFNSGASYQYAQLDLRPFTASVRQVKALDKTDTLSQLLYGETDSLEWSVGLSGQLLGGTGYLSYVHYEHEDPWYDSQNDNVSLSWTRNFLGGTLGINLSYLMFQGDQDDHWSSSLTWTRKFGSQLTGRVGVYVDDDGFAYNQSSLTADVKGEDWSASGTAGAKLGAQWTTAELSGAVNGHSEYAKYNAYGYLNGDGQGAVSGTMSGTQIVSPSGVVATHQTGKAFANINPNLEQDTERDINVNYQLTRDKRYWYRGSVDVTSSQLLTLPHYTEVGIELDADNYNAELDARYQQHFVMPGMYYSLDTSVSPLLSQRFVFSDMNGDPIQSVRCFGDGCKSVEMLSEDGVFRVNYRQGEAFKLISDKRLCVYDDSLMGRTYINAYCLPGLDNVGDNLVWDGKLDKALELSRSLLYLGKYPSNDEAKSLISRLEEAGLTSKVVPVGQELYVYVHYQEQYTTAQRHLLEDLEAYVIFDTVYPDELFSVR